MATIVPIKCHCGKLLANRYKAFRTQVDNRKVAANVDPSQTQYLTKRLSSSSSSSTPQKSIEAIVLDSLRLTKPCCRSKMLTHVEIL